MSKKVLSLALGAMLLAPSFPVDAQPAKKVPLVSYLSPASAGQNAEAFRRGLRELDYAEGKNIVLEWRFAEGKLDRLPDFAAELVRMKVDVIVVAGGNAAFAAKKATSTIPIVIAAAGDPVGTGLVASLARPGGNITGLTILSPELSGKRLELLKEAVPGITRVAALVYPDNPAYALMLKETQEAARALRLQLQILEVRSPDDFDSAFRAAKKERAGALNVLSSAFFTAHRKKLLELAAKNRLPAIYHNEEFVENGGLMFYGPSIADLNRRAATFVDKILKGRTPADLPVEQPMKIEFIINLIAAKQIGLTIPPNVLVRADKVIR
jgi:putative ABC transport system substrate-binding protein